MTHMSMLVVNGGCIKIVGNERGTLLSMKFLDYVIQAHSERCRHADSNTNKAISHKKLPVI